MVELNVGPLLPGALMGAVAIAAAIVLQVEVRDGALVADAIREARGRQFRWGATSDGPGVFIGHVRSRNGTVTTPLNGEAIGYYAVLHRGRIINCEVSIMTGIVLDNGSETLELDELLQRAQDGSYGIYDVAADKEGLTLDASGRSSTDEAPPSMRNRCPRMTPDDVYEQISFADGELWTVSACRTGKRLHRCPKPQARGDFVSVHDRDGLIALWIDDAKSGLRWAAAIFALIATAISYWAMRMTSASATRAS